MTTNSDEEEETVWVAGNNVTTNVYHTDRECSHGPPDPRARRRDTMEAWDYRECHLCANTTTDNDDQDGYELNRVVKNTNPNDI